MEKTANQKQVQEKKSPRVAKSIPDHTTIKENFNNLFDEVNNDAALEMMKRMRGILKK